MHGMKGLHHNKNKIKTTYKYIYIYIYIYIVEQSYIKENNTPIYSTYTYNMLWWWWWYTTIVMTAVVYDSLTYTQLQSRQHAHIWYAIHYAGGKYTHGVSFQ